MVCISKTCKLCGKDLNSSPAYKRNEPNIPGSEFLVGVLVKMIFYMPGWNLWVEWHLHLKKKNNHFACWTKNFYFSLFLVQSGRWIHCIHILVYREELSTDLEHIFEEILSGWLCNYFGVGVLHFFPQCCVLKENSPRLQVHIAKSNFFAYRQDLSWF